MAKIKEISFIIHEKIKYINFILLKRKLVTYFVMAILFSLAIFFFVYLNYSYRLSQIKVIDSSLYRLQSNINELRTLEKEMNEREGILVKILNEFKKNSINYFEKDNVISFSTGYLKYDTFVGLISAIENTGFLKILDLEITNLNGNEKNIIDPNKYIYLKKLVIYSSMKVEK
jgi:hypothetical protein